MDDKVASLLQLMDQCAELYDMEHVSKGRRFQLVQEFVSQQKTQMGVNLQKFSKFMLHRGLLESEESSSSRIKIYQFDSVAAIFDDIVMDVPMRDYEH
jgi:hypothetical protein